MEKKQQKLLPYKSNINDITNLLGPPSTKSTFDNDLWIYIEREISNDKLIKFGDDIIIKNNILIIELDKKGILVKKNFFDKSTMNELKFDNSQTQNRYRKNLFVYDFLSSMRQKINDPLNKRKKP